MGAGTYVDTPSSIALEYKNYRDNKEKVHGI